MNLYSLCILNVLMPRVKQTCLLYLLHLQYIVNKLPFSIRQDVYNNVPLYAVDVIVLCLVAKQHCWGQVYLRHLFCPVSHCVRLKFLQPLHVVQRYCEAQNYMYPLKVTTPTSFNVVH
ncbi:hypothetical protein QKQ25_gp046 [Hyphantria cunea granulovirus]|uniref:Uncharacterized protein n=1 Tax=Hyphantria cunea granulovirus TaxID=307448 RepID=A0AAF1D271_9BBAC|nr:hypothetical protein QKQ25_gp046 [Hyphantria cunea granulovirus]QBQ01599.1 hypothetical protein HycuGV_00046 [Hyphantria cunea granulovirus]